jgi:hypothetical protein
MRREGEPRGVKVAADSDIGLVTIGESWAEKVLILFVDSLVACVK